MSKNQTTKFIREYGMTLVVMSNKYRSSTYFIYMLHQRGELHQFIAEQEEKKVKEEVRK
jgi:hypothetical protein